MKKLKQICKCPECGKIVSAKIPKGGDGSMWVPVWHKDNERKVGSFVKPHDRFKNAALFLCGYLSYPNERIDEVASIIRRYAALNEPYELCTCQKCNQVVELEFYEGDDEECSHPHYHCPNSNCRANYYDKSGKERCEELDEHYKDIEERYREQLEDSWDAAEW